MSKHRTKEYNQKVLFEGGVRDGQYAWFPAEIQIVNIPEGDSYIRTDRQEGDAIILELKGA